jgi:hypothetical protein
MSIFKTSIDEGHHNAGLVSQFLQKLAIEASLQIVT